MKAKFLPKAKEIILTSETGGEGFALTHAEAEGHLQIVSVGEQVVARVDVDPSATYRRYYQTDDAEGGG